MIELLIVIIIFSMLTVAAFPTISRVTAHSRVNQAAMVVAQDLGQAIGDAVRQRKPVRLARGADLKSITVSDRATGMILSTRALGSGDVFSIDSVSLSPATVDVFPNGFTSGALTVIVSAGGYSRQVTMSRAGWVRVP